MDAERIARRWGASFNGRSHDGDVATGRMEREAAKELAAALTDAGFVASVAVGTGEDRDAAWVYIDPRGE